VRRIAFLIPIALIASVFAPAHAAVVKITDVRFTMTDLVRITADVYLPGPPSDGPYPCVVEHTPYRKESRAAEGASLLPGEGIALIEVDARGTGGSGGEYDFPFSLREQYDAAEIVEKVATTDFLGAGSNVCLPKVGMYGGSYSGIIQTLVATLPPPHYPEHLAAIAPQRAYGDLYRDIVYHGGMVIGSFGLVWSGGTTAFYTQPPTDIATADGQAAWLDHMTKNDPMMLHYLNNPTIDARDKTSGIEQDLYRDSSALPRIGNLKVPALHLAGWLDTFTRGQLLTFKAALANERPEAPNFLVIGPWNHSNTHFITPENKPGLKQMLAGWYKHWLAGGPKPAVMDGPKVQYYLMGPGVPYKVVDPRPIPDPTGEWRTAGTWPVEGVSYEKRFLRAGGLLSTQAASGTEADASYIYNPLAGTGDLLGRWDNAASGQVPHPYWDQQTDEPKGLSYTTEPLATDTRVVGPINLHLKATTLGLPGDEPADPWPGPAQLVPPNHDTDFVVKLTDVAPDGNSTLVTQGYLRASHRALDVANSEFDGFGNVVRAQHFHDAANVSPPSGTAETYDIEIWPTAKIFAQGHRLRLDIYSADTPNHLTLLKPALNTVHHSAGESWLLLPLLPA
jgi:putative CocE/NonD family hydrolase